MARRGKTGKTGRKRTKDPANFADSAKDVAAANNHYRARRFVEAERACRRILAVEAENLDALNTLGAAIMDQGRLEEALACFHRALSLQPSNLLALYNMALTLQRQGQADRAIEAYQRALAVKPDLVQAHNNLGNLFKDRGDLDEAAKAYRQALVHAPNHATAHNNLGIIHEKQGNLDEALKCYHRSIEIDPNLADAHTNLGNVLMDRGEFDAAVTAHERAIALRPDFAAAYFNLGNVLKAIGTIDTAIARYRKAIALAPDYGEAYCNLGAAFQERGDDEAAIANYEKAIAFDPGFAFTYYLLLTTKKFAPNDPIIETIKHRVEAPSTSPTDRAAMLLGLANVYDKAGDYATAFATASRANEISRSAVDFSSEENRNSIERIIRLFPKEIFSKKNGYGNDSRLPIFVVGMPRAGKTLVERILAAHPLVHAAHENRDFTYTVHHVADWLGSGLPYPECMDSLTPGEGRQIGDRYIASLRKHWPDSKHLTITHPFNYLYLGLIQLVLPQAPIIHCMRDPLDTCLRCYFKNFKALPFTFDLTELGDFYLSYQRLMAHWRSVLPRPILDVEFERLVGDPVKVGQEIYAYCGLEEEGAGTENPAAVEPPDEADIFRFLSHIGDSESGRWRHYAQYLQPLRKMFADAASIGD